MKTDPSHTLVGGIEAGGTKFVCAVASGTDSSLLDRASFPVGKDPSEVLGAVAGWLLARQKALGPLSALGVALFGPVDLQAGSPTYGFITTTPKSGWRNTDVVGRLQRAFPGLPIGVDTDVNGAGLGEWRWGAARGLEDFIYLTMGTGIGGGGMARGRLLHGLAHPEMGHMGLPRIEGDTFAGACPFHGRCWEGLCSGPAIAKRTGMPAEELPADHPAWDLTARYTAQALVNLTYVLSPRRIIVGGSVRKGGRYGEERFFERVREEFHTRLAGYIDSPAFSRAALRDFIVPPVLGDDAGVLGAIALARARLGSGA